jgi:N-acetylglucosaminyldiphosphoundecaprenol N-acetyl-beta-D-mannosaminyltransferase
MIHPAQSMRFGAFPITETASFPPAPAAECWVYLTLNAEIALSLRQNPELQQLIRSQRTRISVDGQWLWWALQRKYPGCPLRKLSGSDLIYVLAADCARVGSRLLLLGSSPAMNALAVRQLRERWPSLAVAGYAPERFGPGEAGEREMQREALDAIAAFRPDYVVLGLGAAKEQRFALQCAAALDGKVRGLLCFGGAIDMASGVVKRAPSLLQCIGLEGLYRVWQQPARLGRLLRVLRVLPMLAKGAY